MGMDLWVGSKQFRITNYTFYNEFLNIVSKLGEYPYLLDHSPVFGEYGLTSEKVGLYTGSVKGLKEELTELSKIQNLPEYARYIITEMLKVCDFAIEKNIKITLEEGED